ncbi:mRNA (guanine-N7-)-methyltransferase [Marchantia polymorpha subsp. ruderalis]|uniref:mRNA (guanine-N(7))-methyltransferase n=2 Tax=Marchantia polymorpha TaxID=3197 RepID=A0AAF6AXS8_MARPO|nr:hypothetical protein MARPO_0006s0044 [Marchantia polymorpha]BBN04562.1 hypothetical protein Mp_3g05730 [Marchantia polymorpha subsp. ruderalis]|eukprot:PTQ47999.1 hypothetical protein MARPO_0006s0044 [Marchantia polymorpha]
MAANSWIPNGAVGWPPGGMAAGLQTRLLGFVKRVLMRQLLSPGAVVCDLFCGRGLDTERWAEAEIGRYIGVDLSASALEEAREQWERHDKPFAADFVELDPCIVELEDHLEAYGLPVDVVCCLAHLQDSFTSEDMVRHLLKNVATVLKPGGFFFGTAPDSSTIWYKYQKAVEGAMKNGSLRVNGTLPCVRTELYKISFDDDRFLAFGSKYHLRFTDDGLPAQAQLLVHFPTLIRLAREVGLECVDIQNLQEFYDDSVVPFADVLKNSCASLVDSKGVAVLDARGRLSTQAVDVLALYTTFIFKKGDTESQGFEPSPRSENVVLSPTAQYLAQFPPSSMSHHHRRQEAHSKEEHIPLHSELPLPSTSSSRQDEKPREGVHHGDDCTESAGANGEMWAADSVPAVSEVTHDIVTEQERQETIDYSHRFSEDRLRGLKKGMKEKYYTRAARAEVHHATEIEDGHSVAKGTSEFKTWPSKMGSTSGGARPPPSEPNDT